MAGDSRTIAVKFLGDNKDLKKSLAAIRKEMQGFANQMTASLGPVDKMLLSITNNAKKAAAAAKEAATAAAKSGTGSGKGAAKAADDTAKAHARTAKAAERAAAGSKRAGRAAAEAFESAREKAMDYESALKSLGHMEAKNARVRKAFQNEITNFAEKNKQLDGSRQFSYAEAIKAGLHSAGFAARKFRQDFEIMAKDLQKELGETEVWTRKFLDTFIKTGDVITAVDVAARAEIQSLRLLGSNAKLTAEQIKKLAAAELERLAIHQRILSRSAHNQFGPPGRDANARGLEKSFAALVGNVRSFTTARIQSAQAAAKAEVTAANAAREAWRLMRRESLRLSVTNNVKDPTAQADKAYLRALAMGSGPEKAKANYLAILENSARRLNAQLELLKGEFGGNTQAVLNWLNGIRAALSPTELLAQEEERLAGSIARAGAAAAEATAKFKAMRAMQQSGNRTSAFGKDPTLLADRAFNRTIAQGGGIGQAKAVHMNVLAAGASRLNGIIKQLAPSFGGSAQKAMVFANAIHASIPETEAMAIASNGLNVALGKTGAAADKASTAAKKTKDSFQRMGKIGEIFAGLFVFDRIGQWFRGIAGFIVEAGKEAASFEIQLRSLEILSQKLGISKETLDQGVRDASKNMLSRRTAVEGLESMIKSGLVDEGGNIDKAVAQLAMFEESALAVKNSTRGLSEQVLVAAEAFRDRMPRALGKSTGMQTNFGQAARLSTKALLEAGVAAEIVAKKNTLQKESMKWFAGFAGEFRIKSGIMAEATKTTSGQLAILNAEMDNLRLTIGLAFSPAIGVFAKMLNTEAIPALQKWISENVELTQRLLVATFAVSVFIAAFTTLAIGMISIIFAFTFLASTIGLIPVVVVASVVALSGLRLATNTIQQTFYDLAEVVVWLVSTFRSLATAFLNIKNGLTLILLPIKMVLETLLLLPGTSNTVAASMVADTEIMGTAWEQLAERVGNSINDMRADMEDGAAGTGDVIKAAQARLLLENPIIKAIATLVPPRVNTDLAEGAEGPPNPFLNESKGTKKDRELKERLQAQIDNFLEQMNNWKRQFDKLDNPWQEFGEDATKGADRTRRATENILNALLSFTQNLRDSAVTTFFDEGSFQRSMEKFNADLSNAREKAVLAVSRSNQKIIGLDKTMADVLAKKNVDPEKKSEALKNLSDVKAHMLEIAAFTNRVLEEQLTTEEIIKDKFRQKELDKQLAAFDSIKDFSNSAYRTIGNSQANIIARTLASNLEAVAAMESEQINSMTNIEGESANSAKRMNDIRRALTTRATNEALAAMRWEFKALETSVREVGSVFVSAIMDAFDLVKRNQESISNAQARAQALLTEQQMINEIQKSEDAERTKQLRIMAVQRDTQNQIRKLHAETVGLLDKLWGTFMTSLQKQLLERLVNKTIENQILPAFGKLFKGGIPGFSSKAISAGEDLNAGGDIVDSLNKIAKSTSKLGEITAFEEKSKGILADIKLMLATHFEKQSRPPGAVNSDLPTDSQMGRAQANGGAIPQPEDVVEARRPGGDLVGSLTKMVLAIDGIAALTMLTGSRLSKGWRAALFGMNLSLAVVKLLQEIGVIHTKEKVKQLAVDTFTTEAIKKLGVAALNASILMSAKQAASSFIGPPAPNVSAGGNIFTKPGITSIAENFKAEAVVPLNTGAMDYVAKSIALAQRRSGGGGGTGGSVMVQVDLDVPFRSDDIAHAISSALRKEAPEIIRRTLKTRLAGAGKVT